MERKFSLILGSGLALLALSGFVKQKKPKHLAGIMNVDTEHSVLRLPLSLLLLLASSVQTPLRKTRNVLSFVGLFYIAMGSVGLADKSVGGTLPSKQTNFDLAYHFGVGALVLWLGMRSGRMMK
jgi:hypothetical protein